MPSIEKAILDPFAPLGWGDAIMVAVCGMAVVFLVLAVLALMIVVISKVVGAIEGKAPAAPAPKAPAAPVAPAAPRQAAAPQARVQRPARTTPLVPPGANLEPQEDDLPI